MSFSVLIILPCSSQCLIKIKHSILILWFLYTFVWAPSWLQERNLCKHIFWNTRSISIWLDISHRSMIFNLAVKLCRVLTIDEIEICEVVFNFFFSCQHDQERNKKIIFIRNTLLCIVYCKIACTTRQAINHLHISHNASWLEANIRVLQLSVRLRSLKSKRRIMGYAKMSIGKQTNEQIFGFVSKVQWTNQRKIA